MSDTKHEIMPNGEERTRIENATYIRTSRENCESGAWQSSHWHLEVTELFIVQKGSAVLATLENDTVKIKVFHEGNTFTVEPLIHHNLYLPAKAIIHTIKYNQSLPRDWFGSPELDEQTKNLPWVDILCRHS